MITCGNWRTVMATTITPRAKRKVASKMTSTGKKSSRKPAPESLAKINKRMTENHDKMMRLAEKNTQRLTGKPRL